MNETLTPGRRAMRASLGASRLRWLWLVPVFGIGVCTGALTDLRGTFVGRMGGQEITAAELESLLGPEARLPSREVLERVVRQELLRRAVLKEALSKGWDRKTEVATRMQRAGDEVLLRSYLDSASAAPQDYPPTADVEAFYRQHQEAFKAPARYRVSQIYLASADKPGSQGDDAVQSRLRDLAREASKDGAAFAEVAQANSQHASSAKQGGDMGWVPEDQLVPALRAPLQALAKGQISEPLRTADGWHVLRLDDRLPAGPRPLAEVRDGIVRLMRTERARENERAYLKGVVERQPLQLDENRIASLWKALQ